MFYNANNCSPASGAGLPLYEKPEEVEYHEHDMIVEQRWVHRFGDQEHWNHTVGMTDSKWYLTGCLKHCVTQ